MPQETQQDRDRPDGRPGAQVICLKQRRFPIVSTQHLLKPLKRQLHNLVIPFSFPTLYSVLQKALEQVELTIYKCLNDNVWMASGLDLT